MAKSRLDPKAETKAEKETGNSLHRQWQILSRLPNGKWIGTRDLQEQLQREGIDISLRTIQRDLNQIAERFPIENNGATPQGWRWKSDAPIQSIPHMNSSQAVTFMMVEEHLKHLLPPSLLAEINPWFDLARKSLSSHQNNVRQWINRVRIIPATQPLIPPVVDRKAQTAIYEALLQDRQLECIYVKRNAQKEEKTYVLNPLALVQRGAIIYLVCTRQDKSEVQTFALHRFKSATVLDSRALHPVGFDIDQYIDTGTLGFRVDLEQATEDVQLVLHMHQNDAMTFIESKLSKDQQITDLEDDMKRISATVPFNLQLVWWLRGFGKKITHIEPAQVAELVWENSQ
ncbi:Predicted DNA-binding transcriptional regulator YafY, contains an HTH and WYL domains [Acinetobacter marinus]|uniref:Predicted DNA-binding transcriptional regulator YafY, contains an HTH and WYL domains n=1 Tax=Acinetobacter marinus TaxID=281375 RepID=A0A1G6JGX5_9GAMM|nr:WYL domain-containing protein [Acinetobacter marinus]SDC17980.1 Predicted DNA-binding transcriptional regulator YafY, contains an HTH and WYL domains [Acinetobacter marinus]